MPLRNRLLPSFLSFLLLAPSSTSAAGIPRPGSACASEREQAPYAGVEWGGELFKAPTYDPCFWEHLRHEKIGKKRWDDPKTNRCELVRDLAAPSMQACDAAKVAATAPDALEGRKFKDPAEERAAVEEALNGLDAKKTEAAGSFLSDSPQLKAVDAARKKLARRLGQAKSAEDTGKASQRMLAATETGKLKASKTAEKKLLGAKDIDDKKETLDTLIDGSRKGGKRGAKGAQAGKAAVEHETITGDQLKKGVAVADSARHKYGAERKAPPPAAGASSKERIDPKAPDAIDKQLRPAFIERMEKNPIAREFAVPMLKDESKMRITIDQVPGEIGRYDHGKKLLTLDRDVINHDIVEVNAQRRKDGKPLLTQVEEGKLLTKAQKELIADRMMPVMVHETAHQRHFQELETRTGGKQPAKVKETEVAAFKLQALTVAAERKKDPAYLKDGSHLGKEIDSYTQALEDAHANKDPRAFERYVDGVGNYKSIPSALDPNTSRNLKTGYKELHRAEKACEKDPSSRRCADVLDTMETVLPATEREELRKERREAPEKSAERLRKMRVTGAEVMQTLPAAKDYYTGEYKRIEALEDKYLEAPAP